MPQTVLAQGSTDFHRILPTHVHGPVQTTCVHRLRTRVVCSLYRLKLDDSRAYLEKHSGFVQHKTAYYCYRDNMQNEAL